MSAANSAAKKRRAPIEQPRPTYVSPNASIRQQVTSTSTPSGLTLPQVIALIDKRLVSLESFTTDRNDSNTNTNDELQELTNEIDSRFEILIEEFANLKNIVMSLQSYTMDVNKMLLEERLNQLSNNIVAPDDSVVKPIAVEPIVVEPIVVEPIVDAPIVDAPIVDAPIVVVDDIPDKIVINKVIPNKGKGRSGSRISAV